MTGGEECNGLEKMLCPSGLVPGHPWKIRLEAQHVNSHGKPYRHGLVKAMPQLSPSDLPAILAHCRGDHLPPIITALWPLVAA